MEDFDQLDRRAAMRRGAWSTALHAVDDRGELVGEQASLAATFAKRTCCRGVDRASCTAAFHTAVAVARAAIGFRRAKCPQNAPAAARAYELLHQLARHLESEVAGADQLFILAACRDLDMRWSR